MFQSIVVPCHSFSFSSVGSLNWFRCCSCDGSGSKCRLPIQLRTWLLFVSIQLDPITSLKPGLGSSSEIATDHLTTILTTTLKSRCLFIPSSTSYKSRLSLLCQTLLFLRLSLLRFSTKCLIMSCGLPRQMHPMRLILTSTSRHTRT